MSADGSWHRVESHTSELVLELGAPTLPALFAEAARGLADILCERHGELLEEELVSVQTSDRVALLVDWLNELVAKTDMTGRVFPEAEVVLCGENALRARVRSAEIETLGSQVKAVTLHRATIEPEGRAFRATLVFDV